MKSDRSAPSGALDESSLSRLLQEVEIIVRAAGDLARGASPDQRRITSKSDGHPVTEADMRVHELIASQLEVLEPSYGLRSEEGEGWEAKGGDCTWVLDPIDGTRHYGRGNPNYGVSLGLECRGEPVLGAVCLPELDQLYLGAKGLGAHLNGERIQCSDRPALRHALVCVELPSRASPPENLRRSLEGLGTLIGAVERVRVLGVSSMGVCLAAKGGFDAWLSLGSSWKSWDVAAARLILTEAGGEWIEDGRLTAAGPPDLCRQLLALAQESATE